jgi:predicted ribosome quality control (RQC) complex YloA/Tae2 family protein
MKTEYVKVSGIPVPIEFWIGSNAQDNFDMIDEAGQYDLWFHINNESSGHVIARISDNKELNKNLLNKIIIQGGLICKKYSKYKSKRDLEIVYTRIFDIVKTHTTGKVLLRSSKVFII